MRKNKVLALTMSAILAVGVMFTGCSSEKETDNNGQTKSEVNYGLTEYIKDGAILQCFCWSFNTISDSMEDIARAGYSAIQTSPANECIVGGNGGMELMGQGKWYYHYQPTDWTIGNYQLGTKEEFKAMCEKAESYGIKVIVDVVPNHTTGDTESVSENLINAVGGLDKLYHTTGKKGIESYADRAQCTLYQLSGLNDVNTENKEFQDYFIKYINECIACGADGFRYDTAKHIGLSDDPKDTGVTENNFWDRVLTEIDNADKIFNYGEVLQGDNERIEDYIAKIGATTASNYGGNVRTAAVLGIFDVNNLSSYGVGSNNSVVTWVESHDNYTGDGSATQLDDEDIKLAWAFITAREEGTPLFFPRPYGSNADNMWGTMNRIGVPGSNLYKDATVVAANKFRNAMVGEAEKLYNVNDDTSVVFVERGTKGLVIINGSNETKTLDIEVGLADGKYVNRVDNSTEYTVSGGKISGTINSRSAVVLYNDGYKDTGVTPVVDIAEGTNCVYNTDTLTVTLKAVNTSKATYSIDGAAEVEYKDGQSIEIKPASEDKNVTTLVLKGTSSDGNNTYMKFEFTKKVGIVAGTKIYFKVPAGWGTELNAYVYDESTSTTKTNAEWPGAPMTDEGNGVYSYTFEEAWDNGLVIFNDGTNQLPASMEPGFEIEADKTYSQE
ncbi:MAG: starch-binding protein [Lachnospiraceae bacterium]|nr:starch-binding protein [Lachnospiraceae bacterium]